MAGGGEVNVDDDAQAVRRKLEDDKAAAEPLRLAGSRRREG